MIQETREISVVVLGCLPSSQIILPKQWCEGDTGSPYQEENNEGIGQDLVDTGLLSFPRATLSQVRPAGSSLPLIHTYLAKWEKMSVSEVNS